MMHLGGVGSLLVLLLNEPPRSADSAHTPCEKLCQALLKGVPEKGPKTSPNQESGESSLTISATINVHGNAEYCR